MKKYSKYLILYLLPIMILISVCFIPIRVSSLIPIIEKQISEDFGAKVRIEKLILRIGPFLKVKTPVMHIMYGDGQKFAQFDNVKFYIPWHSLLKDKPIVNKIIANKLILRINSDDEFLMDLIEKNQLREFKKVPNINLKQYKITYNNKINNDKYILEGQDFSLNKLRKYKSFKIKSKGSFNIDSIKYLTYDLSILPELNLEQEIFNIDITKYLEQIKDLDFHSDLIADLKIYKNQANLYQASGFINIDNVSVLDYSKKNPKSFAYLTLWGDKASLLSNIYTSNTQKIYIEGMINNSKKPIIDLKVKTDEISLADLYNKLRILADFSVLKNIDEINGKLNANFTLKGDLNKIKSNGYLKITDASLKADGLNINKINSNIDFSNNTINITDAIGYVNNSPIVLKGFIDKKINLELLMSRVELKYLLPSSLGVKSGLMSLAAKITGTFDNVIHKENLQIDNFSMSNKYLDLKLDSAKIDTNKNNTANIDNVICKTSQTEQIKIPSLKLIIEDDFLKIPETNIYMPNSKLSLKSEVLNYNNKDITFNVLLDGFINSKDIIKFNNQSFRYPIKLILNGNKNVQNIASQVLIENTAVFDEITLVNLSSKLDKNSLKIDDLSLYSFNGKLQDDLKLNIKGQKKVFINGVIDNLKEPSLKNIRIQIPQVLNTNFKDFIAQLKGDVFINGTIDKPEIVGQIMINNLVNQQLRLNLSNTSLDFNKNILQINSPLIKLDDSSFSLNSNLDIDFTKDLTFNSLNIKSKFINTDTLLMYKDFPLFNLYPIVVKEGKLYSEKVFANIYDSPLYLSAFSCDINLNNDLLTLKNISSELFNGKLAGKIKYNLHDEHFETDIMARSVSSEPIFKIISNRNDNISGVMDFDAKLKGELISKQSLLGNIKFVVNNGRMSSLGKLEHLLYAQNVVADNMLRTTLSAVTKAISLKDTGLFKYLRGDIELENGIARIKMLQSQGPLMALFIKGTYNPLNNHAGLIVLGRLSDEIVSGLGAFGDFSFNKLMIMLTGEDEKDYLLPEDFEKLPQLTAKETKEFRAIINGNIDKPSSVLLFNWISYSKKSLKQKEIPMTDLKVPNFINELPY